MANLKIILFLFASITISSFSVSQDIRTNRGLDELSKTLISVSQHKQPYRVGRTEQAKLTALIVRFSVGPNYIPDSLYPVLHSSLEVLSKAAQKDTNCIRTILNIASAMDFNAEFSETSPCYIQKAVVSNPVGFIRMLLKMKPTDADDVLDRIKWECEINLSDVFRSISKSARDKEVKNVAEWLTQVFRESTTER